jgi:hypothetical protein
VAPFAAVLFAVALAGFRVGADFVAAVTPAFVAGAALFADAVLPGSEAAFLVAVVLGPAAFLAVVVRLTVRLGVPAAAAAAGSSPATGTATAEGPVGALVAAGPTVVVAAPDGGAATPGTAPESRLAELTSAVVSSSTCALSRATDALAASRSASFATSARAIAASISLRTSATRFLRFCCAAARRSSATALTCLATVLLDRSERPAKAISSWAAAIARSLVTSPSPEAS